VAPHFFKATDEELSQTEVYNFNVPTFGKGVVYDVDQKVSPGPESGGGGRGGARCVGARACSGMFWLCGSCVGAGRPRPPCAGAGCGRGKRVRRALGTQRRRPDPGPPLFRPAPPPLLRSAPSSSASSPRR
jgi:hypothetical protein